MGAQIKSQLSIGVEADLERVFEQTGPPKKLWRPKRPSPPSCLVHHVTLSKACPFSEPHL